MVNKRLKGFVEIILIAPYTPRWPQVFRDLGKKLRDAIGSAALRIDHIGSTSIPGLGAKPIIDIQISVSAFDPIKAYREPLERLGFQYREKNPERTKRYFREPDRHDERKHIHVRRTGSFSEQLPLLFRDYMRCHKDSVVEYEWLKIQLANRFGNDRTGYTEAKADFIWKTIWKADRWAQGIGWLPGPSDF